MTSVAAAREVHKSTDQPNATHQPNATLSATAPDPTSQVPRATSQVAPQPDEQPGLLPFKDPGVPADRIDLASRYRTSSFRAYRVLQRLAWHQRAKAQCWPKQHTLALDLGMDVRHVRRALADLAADGVIAREVASERTRARGGSNHYRIDWRRLEARLDDAPPTVKAQGQTGPVLPAKAQGQTGPVSTGPNRPCEEVVLKGEVHPLPKIARARDRATKRPGPWEGGVDTPTPNGNGNPPGLTASGAAALEAVQRAHREATGQPIPLPLTPKTVAQGNALGATYTVEQLEVLTRASLGHEKAMAHREKTGHEWSLGELVHTAVRTVRILRREKAWPEGQ